MYSWQTLKQHGVLHKTALYYTIYSKIENFRAALFVILGKKLELVCLEKPAVMSPAKFAFCAVTRGQKVYLMQSCTSSASNGAQLVSLGVIICSVCQTLSSGQDKNLFLGSLGDKRSHCSHRTHIYSREHSNTKSQPTRCVHITK